MTGRNAPVRLVLDRSALEAYLSGSVHVTETLHEIVDDAHACFAVPAVALAMTVAGPRADLELLSALVGLDACVLVGVEAGDWLDLSDWIGVTGGRVDSAAAALAALDHAATILTAETGLYGGEVPTIDIPGR